MVKQRPDLLDAVPNLSADPRPRMWPYAGTPMRFRQIAEQFLFASSTIYITNNIAQNTQEFCAPYLSMRIRI